MRFVIDASVAAKWFLPDEPYSAKATRHQRLTVGETRAAIRVIEDLQTVMVPAATLLEGTLQIAQSYDRTFYDSLYIAVAIQQQTHVVTADEKLANATAAYLPVKWIGSLSD